MNKQVKELVERVGLTPEEIQVSIADWEQDRYYGKTQDTSSINYTLKAQVDKVLNDPDLALIDRERYKRVLPNADRYPIILLAEALKEMEENEDPI